MMRAGSTSTKATRMARRASSGSTRKPLKTLVELLAALDAFGLVRRALPRQSKLNKLAAKKAGY